MKTYLTVKLGGEGPKPSEMVGRLARIGFKPLKGTYDFVYEWSKEASLDEVIMLGNTVQRTLKGGSVLFKMETL